MTCAHRGPRPPRRPGPPCSGGTPPADPRSSSHPGPGPAAGLSPGDRAARPACGPSGAPARTAAAPAAPLSPRSAPSSSASPSPCCPSTAGAPPPPAAAPAAASAPARVQRASAASRPAVSAAICSSFAPITARSRETRPPCSPAAPGSSDTSRKHAQPALKVQPPARVGVSRSDPVNGHHGSWYARYEAPRDGDGGRRQRSSHASGLVVVRMAARIVGTAERHARGRPLSEAGKPSP